MTYFQFVDSCAMTLALLIDVPNPRSLDVDERWSRRVVQSTIGITDRLSITLTNFFQHSLVSSCTNAVDTKTTNKDESLRERSEKHSLK